MTERIPPHRHCKQCGKPVSMDETFCSNGCRDDYRNMLRKRKRQLYLYYVLIMIILLLALTYVSRL